MHVQYRYHDIRLSEVHGKTGASDGTVRRNLGTKQNLKGPFQVLPHNTTVDKLGTSLLLNVGKANCQLRSNVDRKIHIPGDAKNFDLL